MRDHRANANARNDRWAALFVGICAAVLAGFIWGGCITAPDGSREPDWSKLDIAGDELISLLDSQSAVWAHRPEVVQDLQRIKAAVQLLDGAVDAILAGGPNTAKLDTYLAAAIELTDELAAQAGDDDLRATFSSIRLALGALRLGLA